MRLLRGRGLGLIPAHAGKTSLTCSLTPPPRAHPRSRGENAGDLGEGIVGTGSSPLTRGKQPGPARGQPRSGLIPAHAGKTRDARPYPALSPAHPRSRGENTLDGLIVDKATGSSPLTRGKQKQLVCSLIQIRLIPAHAGKTGGRRRGGPDQKAHPRSRGENRSIRTSLLDYGGSSPLTRGKPLPLAQLGFEVGLIPEDYQTFVSGLIPAHAGKTRSS